MSFCRKKDLLLTSMPIFMPQKNIILLDQYIYIQQKEEKEGEDKDTNVGSQK